MATKKSKKKATSRKSKSAPAGAKNPTHKTARALEEAENALGRAAADVKKARKSVATAKSAVTGKESTRPSSVGGRPYDDDAGGSDDLDSDPAGDPIVVDD